MAAINNYFHNAKPKTPAALRQKDAWAPWFKKLTWAQKNMNVEVLADAKAKRDAYNTANGTPTKAISRAARNSTIAKRLGVDPNPTVRAPTAKPIRKPTLRRGAKSDSVKAWQQKIGVTPVNGVYDTKTAEATKEWQTQHGLKPDGVVGPKTWAAGLVTDPSPAPVAEAVVDSTGSMPTAKTEEVKKEILDHVVAMGDKIEKSGDDPRTADLHKTAKAVESDKAGMGLLPKTAVGVGIYAAVVGGIIYAAKRAGKL
jgi:peptidoglycan hydrolase-like protein with peptidoglycan-binding domain